VNTKTNPRKVKKPIVKEWCYKPSDLAANGGLAWTSRPRSRHPNIV
jgi:hypothetical protein